MASMRLNATEIFVYLMFLVSALFNGLALWLDGYYMDDGSLNDTNKPGLKSERGVVKGLFLAAFICCLNGWNQMNVVRGLRNCNKSGKINVYIAVSLAWVSFLLITIGSIYIEGTDLEKIREKDAPYALGVLANLCYSCLAVASIFYTKFALEEDPQCA